MGILLAILNIARLLQSIALLCPDSARDEHRQMTRDDGVKVKYFPEMLFQRAKDHAETVYKVLEQHSIPNVDCLHYADPNECRLIFKPRGQETRPANLVQLFRALENVLQALAKLHAASWMHRDIRWANVIKNRSEDSWFLIDFMDAAPSPQQAPSASHLSQHDHAPEIFRGSSHNTAVDIWSVGHLIQTCADDERGSWDDTGGEKAQFLELLMHKDPARRPTAGAALCRLRQLEKAYLDSLRQTDQEYLDLRKGGGRRKRKRQE